MNKHFQSSPTRITTWRSEAVAAQLEMCFDKATAAYKETLFEVSELTAVLPLLFWCAALRDICRRISVGRLKGLAFFLAFEFDEASADIRVEAQSSDNIGPVTRVLASSQCTETITTRLAFVTLSEFWKLFQVEPRSMGLKVYTKRVEFGREAQGVLVRPSAMSASADCRELTMSTSTSCTLEEALVSDDNRLREAEPTDTWNFLNSANAQNLDRHMPHKRS